MEFTSIKFNYFCEKHDIKKQFTQSNTPYPNKVMKCKNRSLVERVKKHGVRKQASFILVG
jgi:hypothetical protein